MEGEARARPGATGRPDRLVGRENGRAPAWQVFMELDDLLTGIAGRADARLAFQNAYPVR
ncbi:hypothetical protein [Nonomuraea aridisoli]|uniref:hypothetical protein n=1 Tax=Nonomuraea aridisoli TaxID=2070368 RepID=UPI0011B94228|nr:hypothetical protein [Nonomuraea aridisoli]